jgi:hypothetical protein
MKFFLCSEKTSLRLDFLRGEAGLVLPLDSKGGIYPSCTPLNPCMLLAVVTFSTPARVARYEKDNYCFNAISFFL